jgi:hypothetical protein
LIVAIVALWLVSEAARRLRPGHLLVDAPLAVKLALPLVLFLGLFLSLLIRLLPVATGYYYGPSFAVLFALLTGLLVKGVTMSARSARLVEAVAVLEIVLIQIDNFSRINAGWIRTHQGGLTRGVFSKLLHVTPPAQFDGRELGAIWQAWRAGQLEEYVERKGVPVEAVYLVYNLRTIDRRGVRMFTPASWPERNERR